MNERQKVARERNEPYEAVVRHEGGWQLGKMPWFRLLSRVPGYSFFFGRNVVKFARKFLARKGKKPRFLRFGFKTGRKFIPPSRKHRIF